MERTFLALFILIILTFISKACEITTVSAIAADSHKFDGKEVCVEGSVSDPHLSSRAGNNYATFGLNDDNGKSLSVYFLGTLSIKEGDKVMVTGKYVVKKIVLKVTLYNEIDAISVEKLQ